MRTVTWQAVHINCPYLGILLSEDLKWSTHISNTSKKSNSTPDSSRRSLCHRPSHCKQNAYQTLVYPLFEYASIVRDYAYLRKEIDSLERIQRNAARFIAGDYRSNTTGSIRKLLSKLGLPSGRLQLRLTFLYKEVKGLVPANF